jgi:hypothetical protein
MISPGKEKGNKKALAERGGRTAQGWFVYRGPAQLFNYDCGGLRGLTPAEVILAAEISFFVGRLKDAAVVNDDGQAAVELHPAQKAVGRGGEELGFLDLAAQLEEDSFGLRSFSVGQGCQMGKRRIRHDSNPFGQL